jgi:hypothetical protein
VFKCDLNYVKERLYLFSDVNDSKPIVKKTESVKDSFIKMMQEPESDLLYSNKFLEKNSKVDCFICNSFVDYFCLLLIYLII